MVTYLTLYDSQGEYQNSLKKINAEQTLQQKLSAYQTAIIIQFAMVEGAVFLFVFTALIIKVPLLNIDEHSKL